jgi:YbbR domain-containing protein
LLADLDLSNARPGRQRAEVKVQSILPDVEVLGAKPGDVEVSLDLASSKTVKVDVHSDPNNEWQLNEVETAPVQVQVSGAMEAVGRVASVRATVDVKSGNAKSLNVPAHLVAIDRTGGAVEDVDITPAVVQVRAQVIERRSEKRVPLQVKLLGMPAPGFEVGKVTVEPDSVAVRGAQRLLESLDSFQVTCDISNAQSDVTRRVKVLLPDDVELASARRVQVRVEIIAKSVDTPPNVSGDLPPPAMGASSPAGNAGKADHSAHH